MYLDSGILMKILCIAFILFFIFSPDVISQDCQGCKRTAVLIDAENLMASSMESRLVETLTSSCFHLQNLEKVLDLRERAKNEGWQSIMKKSEWKPPEYEFMARYEPELKGKIASRMMVRLVSAITGETVDEWISESDRPTFTYNGHINRLFDNPGALIRQERPIEQKMWDFERKPVSCEIILEQKEVRPHQEISVTLQNLQDRKGQKSREFNRVVVQALEGQIKGGTEVAADPDLKAFRIGEGPIDFTYLAPEDCECEEDKIIIYNSCDILDEKSWPLSITEMDQKIAEEEIKIVCGDLLVDIRGTATWGVEDEKGTGTGSARINIRGAMELRDSSQYHESYVVNRMRLEYRLHASYIEKYPPDGCPPLALEISGAGQSEVKEGHVDLIFGKSQNPSARRQKNESSFSFELGVQNIKWKMRARCPDYRIWQEDNSVFRVNVHDESPLEKDQSRFTGSRTWGLDIEDSSHVVMRFILLPFISHRLHEDRPGSDMKIEWDFIKIKR